ncbi:hypothetical protein I9W82_004282 [Candida metapsilosis]|uniref:Uncharacterized protein n=1 Tax=Candida metapsilosis TaxID=273372 RepID=A0A8H7ZCF4_9ASCO|nr:hypothetical protein I9W82_004282 [Candida metapsilosis]
MSSNQSNPIFVDPSIVTLEKDVSTSQSKQSQSSRNQNERKSSHSSIHNLEPGNALSRLLDSAMAHAAKESTPEPVTGDGDEEIGQDENVDDGAKLQEFLSSIPQSKQGQEHIYSVNQLLEWKSDIDDVPHVKELLPDQSFWRLKAQREPRHLNHNNLNSENGGGTYKGRRSKKHQNETWERGKTSHYGADGYKQDPSTRRGGRHGFVRAEELDSLSSDKISQLLGEGPDELEPEWDAEILGDGKIGKSGGGDGARDDDLAHLSMMNMGQTVEDFERWKSQMKLEEKRRRGEVVDEDVEQQQIADEESAAKNAGNEVDNFFSFIKPTNKETSVEEKDVASAKPEDASQNNAGSSANHRASRFSSFFQQPSSQPAQPAKQPEQESSQKQPTSATMPPPGFSKFFGGQKSGPQTPQYTSEPPSLGASETRLPQMQGPSSSWSSPSGPPQPQLQQPQGQQQQQSPMPHLSSNDSFFRSLLKKKESTQPSPSSAKSSPVVERVPNATTDEKRAVSDVNAAPGPLSRKASTGNENNALLRGAPQQQPQQHQQQQQPIHPGQFPPGLFPPNGQFPPWMRGPPQQMGNFPPGFQPPAHSQFQQQQLQKQGNQEEQSGKNNEGGAKQSPSQQQNQSQSQQQQPRFPFPNLPPGQQQQQQQQGRMPMPPPGMFPNGFMPPMPPPPGSNFAPGQGMPPPPPGFRQHQVPPEFMNNPNARFIPPQYMGPPPPGLQQQHQPRGMQQGPPQQQQQQQQEKQ